MSIIKVYMVLPFDRGVWCLL